MIVLGQNPKKSEKMTKKWKIKKALKQACKEKKEKKAHT